jgi:DHA3 family macrolide efflux protein-like MFS transporter
MNHIPSEQTDKKWMAPFFTLWAGQAISLLGSQLVQFALIWWLTQETGSATVLATASLVGLLPQVFLGPIAGALVDRWNRRLVMLVADSFIALATLGLAALFLTGLVQIWHVYLLMFVRSLAGGFHWSSMQASTSLMVPKEQLSRVQGLNQMLNGAMNIGSAPLGALLLTVLNMGSILMIDVVTAMFSIVPLLLIAIPQPPREPVYQHAENKSSVWGDLKAGMRYVWAWPGLVIIMLMATLLNFLLTPASALIPILVTKHFGGQAFELAWLESAWGIGVLCGGLLLGAWGGFRRRILTTMLGLLVMGAGMALIGLLPASAFWLAVGLFFLVGAANPVVNGPLFAAVQAVVAPEMQGRVFTLMLSAAGAMSPVSLIIAGPVADRLGVQSWFVVGGVITIVVGLSGFFIPAVMNFEQGNGKAHQLAERQSAEDLAFSPVPLEGGD